MNKAAFQLILILLIGSCAPKAVLLSADDLEKGNYQEVKYFAIGYESEPQIEKYPMYPNGLNGLMADVGKRIKYPETERLKEIEGKVIVKYVIEKDGTLSNISIEKSVSEALDNEAIRVVKSLKKWYPGFVDGKPVRVEFSQPFDFKLE